LFVKQLHLLILRIVIHAKENYTLGDFYVYESYCFTEIGYLYSDTKDRDQFSFEVVFITRKNI
jgi:hypothetical protein